MSRPRRLPSGYRHRIALGGALLALMLAAPPAGAGESTIRVTLRPPPGAEEAAFARGHLHVQLPEAERRVLLPDSPPFTLSIPEGASAVVRAEVPGFWSPQVAVVGLPETQEVVLKLFAEAAVEGRVDWPRDVQPPREVRLTLDPPWHSAGGAAAKASIPHSSESCPITASGGFRCPVPAARLDLRLRVTGFVSHYFWDLELTPGETHDFNDLPLAPGASVVAWVEDVEGRPPAVPVTATLRPAEAVRGSPRSTGVDRLALRARADERGFLHLQGVPAGAYRLQLEADGFAPVTRRIEVVEGREARVPEPLVLAPPTHLELTLMPPLDPYGRPWEVRWRALEGDAASPWHPVSENGHWQSEPLAPGPYMVRLESGRGRYRHAWWSGNVEVASGGTSEVIQLPVVEVLGTVRLGQEPLEAVVHFGAPHGGRALRLDAGRDGVFAGYLPTEGKWPVSVYTEPTGWRNLPPVEVEVLEGSRYAELELALPDTTLPGEVVSLQGEPLRGVRIAGFHADERFELSGTVSDEEGRFRLRGVAPGRVMLSAQGAGGASGGAMVTVPEEGSTEPVRLVLQEFARLKGRVASPEGPVPGAQVITFPRGMGFFMIEQGRILTGPDGRFEARLPAGATTVDMAVLAPGWAARLFRVGTPWPEEVVVEVRAGGGTLELALPGEGQALLRHDGAELPLVLLNHWGGQEPDPSGGRVRQMPAMDPGTWELCVRDATAGTSPACEQGFLPPSGSLELRSPGRQRSDAASSTPTSAIRLDPR